MLVLLQVFNLNERETSEIYVCMGVSVRMREHIIRDSEFIYIYIFSVTSLLVYFLSFGCVLF